MDSSLVLDKGPTELAPSHLSSSQEKDIKVNDRRKDGVRKRKRSINDIIPTEIHSRKTKQTAEQRIRKTSKQTDVFYRNPARFDNFQIATEPATAKKYTATVKIEARPSNFETKRQPKREFDLQVVDKTSIKAFEASKQPAASSRRSITKGAKRKAEETVIESRTPAKHPRPEKADPNAVARKALSNLTGTSSRNVKPIIAKVKLTQRWRYIIQGNTLPTNPSCNFLLRWNVWYESRDDAVNAFSYNLKRVDQDIGIMCEESRTPLILLEDGKKSFMTLSHVGNVLQLEFVASRLSMLQRENPTSSHPWSDPEHQPCSRSAAMNQHKDVMTRPPEMEALVQAYVQCMPVSCAISSYMLQRYWGVSPENATKDTFVYYGLWDVTGVSERAYFNGQEETCRWKFLLQRGPNFCQADMVSRLEGPVPSPSGDTATNHTANVYAKPNFHANSLSPDLTYKRMTHPNYEYKGTSPHERLTRSDGWMFLFDDDEDSHNSRPLSDYSHCSSCGKVDLRREMFRRRCTGCDTDGELTYVGIPFVRSMISYGECSSWAVLKNQGWEMTARHSWDSLMETAQFRLSPCVEVAHISTSAMPSLQADAYSIWLDIRDNITLGRVDRSSPYFVNHTSFKKTVTATQSSLSFSRIKNTFEYDINDYEGFKNPFAVKEIDIYGWRDTSGGRLSIQPRERIALMCLGGPCEILMKVPTPAFHIPAENPALMDTGSLLTLAPEQTSSLSTDVTLDTLPFTIDGIAGIVPTADDDLSDSLPSPEQVMEDIKVFPLTKMQTSKKTVEVSFSLAVGDFFTVEADSKSNFEVFVKRSHLGIVVVGY